MQRLPRQLCGAALAVSGLGADCVAAVWVLDTADPRSALLHMAAVVVWIAGVRMLAGERHDLESHADRRRRIRSANGRPAARPRRLYLPSFIWTRLTESWTPSDNTAAGRLVAEDMDGWTVVALIVGLVPFPAVGPLALSIARAAVWLLRLVPNPQDARRSQTERGLEMPHARMVSIQRELEVQPIVDILHGSDRALKRAAIHALARQPSGEGVQWLRDLLVDSDADLRDAASLALFRLEVDFERELRRAGRQESATPPAALASLYIRYARSGLLDDISGALYLHKACDALQQAIAAEPDCTRLQFQLASLQSELGMEAEACETLECGLGSGQVDAQSCLEGMDIAFRNGRWEQLLQLAQRARLVFDDDPEPKALIQWWTEAHWDVVGSGA